MTKYFLLLILGFVSLQMQAQVEGAPSLESSWSRYKTQHSKVYSSSAEDAKRSQLFAATDNLIKAHNSNPSRTFTMIHTKFSDMTGQERKSYLGRVVPTNFNRSSSVQLFSAERSPSDRQLPALVDLRKDPCMQPIRNQESCGSCWAFASSAVLEFTTCTKNGNKPISLSPQQLVDCDRVSYGCNGGFGFWSWAYVAKAGGQNTLASYPYIAKTSTCKFKSAASAIGAKVHNVTPIGLIRNKDVNTMMAILANRGVIDIGFAVASPFFNAGSGVFTDKSCGTMQQNHEMVAVGYGTDSKNVNYWIVRNSWGTGWGQAGYVLIQRGVNLCRIEELAAIVFLP